MGMYAPFGNSAYLVPPLSPLVNKHIYYSYMYIIIYYTPKQCYVYIYIPSVSVCPESVGTALWVSPEVPLTGSSFIRSSLEAVAVEEGGGTEVEGEKAVD